MGRGGGRPGNSPVSPWEVYQGELYSFPPTALMSYPSSVPAALPLSHRCFGSIAEIPPLVEMQYYSLSVKAFHPTGLNSDPRAPTASLLLFFALSPASFPPVALCNKAAK